MTNNDQVLCTLCGHERGDHSVGNLFCPNKGWKGEGPRFHDTNKYTIVPSGGMQCAVKFCGELNPYGVPNMPNGKDYVCYSCRQSGRKP